MTGVMGMIFAIFGWILLFAGLAAKDYFLLAAAAVLFLGAGVTEYVYGRLGE